MAPLCFAVRRGKILDGGACEPPHASHFEYVVMYRVCFFGVFRADPDPISPYGVLRIKKETEVEWPLHEDDHYHGYHPSGRLADWQTVQSFQTLKIQRLFQDELQSVTSADVILSRMQAVSTCREALGCHIFFGKVVLGHSHHEP